MKKILSFFLDKKLCYKCAKTCSVDMKENNFTDTDFSRFTSHFSLKHSGATHVALCDSVGSYYRHWCGAFTLAEVLVTLGIIGVVSAMTVPTLMQNYQRQSYVTQLHKVYNETTQAALRYVTDRNALNMKEAGMTSTDAAVNFVNTYFKVVNDCGTNASPCFASEYKRMNGTSMGNLFNGGMRKFSLASGASISVAGFSNGNMSIYVDVNGQKGPNIVGRDTFPMVLYKNGIVDEGDGTEATDAVTPPISADRREEIYNSWCNATGGMWWGCMGKIMNDNWQMTY